MTKLITLIAILVTMALSINVKLTSGNVWKRDAEAEFQKMLDPEYEIIETPDYRLINKWCDYVFRQAEYFDGVNQ